MLCACLSCCLVFESMEVFGKLKTFARFSRHTGQATPGLFLLFSYCGKAGFCLRVVLVLPTGHLGRGYLWGLFFPLGDKQTFK